jgi:uncharacterized RDD family membrane protein YckC
MSDVPPNQGQQPPQAGPPPQQPQQPQQPAGQQPPQQQPQQPAGQQPPQQQPPQQHQQPQQYQQPAGGPPPQQQPGQQPPPQYQQPAGQPGPAVGGPADLTSRFLAKLIDWVLLGIVLGIVWGIAASIFISSALTGGSAFRGGGFLYSLLLTIISTALVLGYFVFMESSRGQTVGKMLLKLKVQTATGANPSMEEAAKRNAYMALYLANVVPWVGWLISSLGLLAANIYIAITINNDTQARRGWHDQFGETQVIKIG